MQRGIQMNIGEEKTFLYGMMKDITEERRRLTETYFSLKERIDTLHKLEEKGLSDLSTKGYIDLFNDRETQTRVMNLNREMQHAIDRERREKDLMKPRYDKVAETLERGQADRTAERERAIQKAKAEADEEEQVQRSLHESEQVTMQLQEQEPEENLALRTQNVLQQLAEARANHKAKTLEPVLKQEEVEKEIKPYSGRGRPPKGYVKPEKPKAKVKNNIVKEKESTPLIGRILRQNGIMKLEDLRAEFSKKIGFEITSDRFNNNILYRALKNDPKIERIDRGLYQYARG